MIIGLFGLSGSGKTYLTSQLSSESEIIATRASQIIKQYGCEINYNRLDKKVIDLNQTVLIEGLKKFKYEKPNEIIVIELHNIIETPEGLSEINPKILFELKLDAACYLKVEPETLYQQRKYDTKRVRPEKTTKTLEQLQKRSVDKFVRDFECFKVPYTVLKNSTSRELVSFIDSIQK